MPSIRIVSDPKELARAAADELVRVATEALAKHGRFSVALAGGSTPRALYGLLADRSDRYFGALAWEQVRFFFGDERAVPPDHADSNYRMAYETLLSKVPVQPGHVVRFFAEGDDPALVTSHYESMLRAAFGIEAQQVPRFDLILLGMGSDGHTASLFPGSEVLHETGKLAAAPWVEKLGTRRYTLTPVVLNHAAHVLFLVAGEDKAESLKRVLEGERDPERFPAQIVEPLRGTLSWFVDRAAGRLLRSSTDG